MKYRKFKKEMISEIGLGTWQLGSQDWGVVNEESAFEILETYVQQGGNFIDTADVYGNGASEKVIGKFLASGNHKLFVASKLGRRHDQPNGWPKNFTYDAMKMHVESTLENLQLSQLYLEQLHCIPTEEMRAGRVFDHLRKLQQEGLIRYWGASVETTEEALICMQQDGLASLQIIFNLFRQHVADEIFELAAANNIALIVRVPLASGLLTGKFSRDTVFTEKDHRNYNANGEIFNVGETFAGIAFNKGVEIAGQLKKLFPDDRMSSWALRWILDHPQVTTVIPGASKPAQVIANAEASSLHPLAPDVYKKAREIYDKQIRPEIRGSY